MYESDYNDDDDNKTIIPVSSQNRNKKPLNRFGLGMLTIIVVAVLGISISTVYTTKHHQAASEDAITEVVNSINLDSFDITNPFSTSIRTTKKPRSPYIAVLYVEGVIEAKNKTYNQSWILSTIDDLKNDNNNKAIMLYINSPGGGVYEADAVYLALEDYKDETEKPVYAYLGPLAASGGYYIACAADTIIANRNTLTGSIGVISGSSVDASQLMDKLGISMTVITAGRNKNMGNINAPLTDEQRAILQSIADEAYDQFTSIVATSRDMPIERIKELADGRIYSAKQAHDNGLIDSVSTWDDALTMLKEQEKLNNCTVQRFKVEEKTSFYEYVKGTISSIGTLSAAINDGKLLNVLSNNVQSNRAQPMYLYQ